MIFSIFVLSVELIEKEILDLLLRKSEKLLCENEILSFFLLAIEEKYLLKIPEIAIGLEMVALSTERLWKIPAEFSLIVIIDFMPFHVFLILFQLDSK